MRFSAMTFLYILLLITFTLGTLEIAVRSTGYFKTYTERVGQKYLSYYDIIYDSWYCVNQPSDTFLLDHEEFQYEYITNSLGLREREIDWSDTNEVRLVIFGDSFTEGVGAPYDSTYPREIERILIKDEYNASVINAGVNGSDPFYSFHLLKDKIISNNPTHVIFCCNRSDIEDHLFRSGFDRFRSDGTTVNTEAPNIKPLYKNSHL